MNENPLIWAEVDLGAVAHNVRELRRITGPSSKLLIAVKANAYGHGIIDIAKCGLKNGADALGVARIDEGIALRKSGIASPILIFGYTTPLRTPDLVKYRLIQTLYSLETARAISSKVSGTDDNLSIHIKIDTGMGRLGLLHDRFRNIPGGLNTDVSSIKDIRSISDLPGLNLEGIYTHFAASDSADKSYAEKQFSRFTDLLDQLDKADINIQIRHAANSGAIIDMPDTHLDMVRAGIAVYGLYPSDEVNKDHIKLKPAMALKARIINLKKVPKGFQVSYGMTYATQRPTTIATVPIGYADGFSRLMSSNGSMLVRGKRAPIIGRICMDLTMLDVGHIPNVELEDEVVIFGRQGDEAITADEIASSIDTINYEVVSSITGRVPRIYIKK